MSRKILQTAPSSGLMPYSEAGEWTRVLVTIEKERKSFTLISYCGDRDDYMETSQFAGSDWTKTFVLLYKPVNS